MKVKKIDKLEIYHRGFEIESIGNQAVRKAIKKNTELGIPTVFSVKGTILYQLPDGEITTEPPSELKDR